MIAWFKEESGFLVMVLLWVLVGFYLGLVAFVFLPLTVLAMKARDRWADMLFGLIVVLVLSDVNKAVIGMRVFKDVKNVYVLALGAFLLLERYRFQPMAGVFPLFLPFFLYAWFPLIFSLNLPVGIQKTISYALMFLLVPNLVLYNFRRDGWTFFRNLMFLIVTLLVVGFLIRYINPKMAFVGGRFSGLFGNPNGLGIFSTLCFILFGVLRQVKKDLFTFRESVIVGGTILLMIILSGSRASLVSVIIFVTFNRFFAYSPFLGFIVLVTLFGVIETVGRNLSTIIMALGLENYFRLHTLDDGSGRYFAWQFAWEKIQDFLVFGGGFSNDEQVMRRNYDYLERMGHQGGVHNSFLSMWFNVGIIGLLIYFRSFVLLFIKASKLQPVSLAVMFAVLFSMMYESWLVGSLNPYTIMLLIIMTVASEEEIAKAEDHAAEEETVEEEQDAPGEAPPRPLHLPA